MKFTILIKPITFLFVSLSLLAMYYSVKIPTTKPTMFESIITRRPIRVKVSVILNVLSLRTVFIKESFLE